MCAEVGGKWDKDNNECDASKKKLEKWLSKMAKIDGAGKKDEKKGAEKKGAEQLNLAIKLPTEDGCNRDSNAGFYAGFGSLVGFAAGILTMSVWNKKQQKESTAVAQKIDDRFVALI